MDAPAEGFTTVLHAELGEIHRSRVLQAAVENRNPVAATTADQPAQAKDRAEAFTRAHDAKLSGLAFSGGGIRSATFSLGVIQALAEQRLLGIFDYLSTVSGGGYIGSWLSAWLKRRGGITAVAEFLKQRGAEDGDRESEPSPLRFLRAYSNFLTPKLGLFSFDTWALVAIYLRNFLLNLTILISTFAAVLLIPRLLVHWFQVANAPKVYLALTGLSLLIGIAGIGFNLRRFSVSRWYGRPEWIRRFVVLPLVIGSFFGTLAMTTKIAKEGRLPEGEALRWIAERGSFYFFAWLAGWLLAYFFSKPKRKGEAATTADPSRGPKFWPFVWSTLAAALLVFGPLLFALRRLLERIVEEFGDGAAVISLVSGPPLILLALLLAGCVHVGLAGRSFSDDRREWISRVGGWLMVWMLVCWAVAAIALLSPYAIGGLWAKSTLGAGWLATTLFGVLGGKSSASGAPNQPSKLDPLLKIAPPVFVLGLLVAIATILHGQIDPKRQPPGKPAVSVGAEKPRIKILDGDGANLRAEIEPASAESSAALANEYLRRVSSGSNRLGVVAGVLVGLLGIALTLAWRVDVNEFSMHLFYRNRLTRCYLGASVDRRAKKANRFTGFSSEDDLPLASLRTRPFTPPVEPAAEAAPPDPPKPHVGPFHLVNTALNLVQGRNLAWQERKAASFVFSPLYSGFDLPRTAADDDEEQPEGISPREGVDTPRGLFRPTETYGQGISLGTAFAVSGAAASPNMGYHSSPALSFLLTVFDVRLGWWLGNPLKTDENIWKAPGPHFAFLPLLGELAGRTNDESKFVYLSDGGHFENLGIYELVKRRCRLIVVTDCGADSSLEFGDLGNAIRKCRNDLGVEIELDTRSIRPGKDGLSAAQFSIGDIRYDRVDGAGAPIGTLILIKPSISCDETADILDYKSRHPIFPQETTADQFFTESQFESYRKLGQSIGRRLFEPVVLSDPTLPDRVTRGGLEPLIQALRTTHPPAANPAGGRGRAIEAVEEVGAGSIPA